VTPFLKHHRILHLCVSILRYFKIEGIVVRRAWQFLNDCFFSSICIETKPEELALACLCLSLTRSAPASHLVEMIEKNLETLRGTCPWQVFEVTDHRLVTIMHQIVSIPISAVESKTAGQFNHLVHFDEIFFHSSNFCFEVVHFLDLV
jgi:hypothetical protein